MFGAAMIGGVAYLQYQAAQAGTYAIDMFGRARDSASATANGFLEGAGDVFAQVGRGWGKTKEDVNGVQMPQWMKDIYEGNGREKQGGEGGPNEPKQSNVGAMGAGAATAGAFGLTADGEDDERTEDEAARDDQMMMLTRKMIEIRSL